MQISNISQFYTTVKKYCLDNNFAQEIEFVTNNVRKGFEQQTPEQFLHQYMYVVINSGMKNQIAEDIYKRALINGITAIGHPGKRKAIEQASSNYRDWFEQLQKKESIDAKLDFLESLPWIGKITKYHLARNIGIDVAKPDRHLVKIAEKFGYLDVQKMCQDISSETGDRVGVIDVILWRAMNLSKGRILEDFMLKLESSNDNVS